MAVGSGDGEFVGLEVVGAGVVGEADGYKVGLAVGITDGSIVGLAVSGTESTADPRTKFAFCC